MGGVRGVRWGAGALARGPLGCRCGGDGEAVGEAVGDCEGSATSSFLAAP